MTYLMTAMPSDTPNPFDMVGVVGSSPIAPTNSDDETIMVMTPLTTLERLIR